MIYVHIGRGYLNVSQYMVLMICFNTVAPQQKRPFSMLRVVMVKIGMSFVTVISVSDCECAGAIVGCECANQPAHVRGMICVYAVHICYKGISCESVLIICIS